MLTKRLIGAAVGGGLALAAGIGIAGAQETDLEASIAELAAAIDIAWLLIAGILVLFMQAGFGLVEAGFIRSKNVTNILMKNTLDLSFGALGYWAVGWGLAYGTTEFIDIRFFGGGSFFFTPESGADYAGFFFQFAFAATAATIVSGAVAERTTFSAYLIYTLAITAVIYPVVTHWVWGAGFLSAYAGDIQLGDNGLIDFAGSTVVHSVGGWAALVAAVILGPRRGKFNADGSVNALPGHSMPLGFLGVMILWIGWYGFNAGSTLGLSGGFADLAARVAVSTTLAAGAGAASSMMISWARSGKSDLSLTLNGVLGGLVGITAGSEVSPPTSTVEPTQTPSANATPVPAQTPTVQPSANPTVAPTTPTKSPDAASLVRLRIPALEVNAIVSPLGFDGAGGFAVPATAAAVGWYDFSARPGAPGNAVLGGHLNWRGTLGVFGRLSELSPGDMIYVDTGEGEVAFRVVDSHSVTAHTPFTDILGERSGPSTLTLFTCGGTFSSAAGEYDQRLVINAVRA